jgi:hypothetical protein
MNSQNENIKNLSLEELEVLKKTWYKENQENINIIILICRFIGRLSENKDEYVLCIGDVIIYVNDRDESDYVTYKGKRVMDTNKRLYIPGEWVDIVMSQRTKAEIEEKRRENAIEEENRKNLIHELSLPE